MTTDFKTKIVEAIREERPKLYESDSAHARALGIAPAIYSQLMAGELDKKLKDAEWNRLAAHYKLNKKRKWLTAHTPAFVYVTALLEECHNYGLGRLLVDSAGSGKTEAARHFCSNTKNAAYIDCSQNKSKRLFIEKLCRAFGIDTKGRFDDTYTKLKSYLRNNKCLVVLDEAADLEYSAFLEIKAMWNACAGNSGFVLMGADGLQSLVERRRKNNKVGYAEIFDRFGNTYQRTIGDEYLAKLQEQGKPTDSVTAKLFQLQATLIAQANMPGAAASDVQKMVAISRGSLRTLREKIEMSY